MGGVSQSKVAVAEMARVQRLARSNLHVRLAQNWRPTLALPSGSTANSTDVAGCSYAARTVSRRSLKTYTTPHRRKNVGGGAPVPKPRHFIFSHVVQRLYPLLGSQSAAMSSWKGFCPVRPTAVAMHDAQRGQQITTGRLILLSYIITHNILWRHLFIT